VKAVFEPLNEQETGNTFTLFKQYMKPVIARSLGWNEAFQQHGFTQRLMPEWFHWVVINEQRVGLVCIKQIEKVTHLHLLIIFTQYQGNGYTEAVTQQLIERAHNENRVLTLSCFKANQAALHLYRKLKFNPVSEDEYFVDFSSDSISVK